MHDIKAIRDNPQAFDEGSPAAACRPRANR